MPIADHQFGLDIHFGSACNNGIVTFNIPRADLVRFRSRPKGCEMMARRRITGLDQNTIVMALTLAGELYEEVMSLRVILSI